MIVKLAKRRAAPAIARSSMPGGKSQGWMVFYGVVSIVLGVVLWRGILGLEQTIALLLVLVGLKKIFCGCQ